TSRTSAWRAGASGPEPRLHFSAPPVITARTHTSSIGPSQASLRGDRYSFLREPLLERAQTYRTSSRRSPVLRISLCFSLIWSTSCKYARRFVRNRELCLRRVRFE